MGTLYTCDSKVKGDKMTTVQQLRQNGYKVRVLHFRNKKNINVDCNPYGYKKEVISNLGGTTKIIIDSPTGEHFEGIARCSNKDNYNKKLGVKIALGRALFNSIAFV